MEECHRMGGMDGSQGDVYDEGSCLGYDIALCGNSAGFRVGFSDKRPVESQDTTEFNRVCSRSDAGCFHLEFDYSGNPAGGNVEKSVLATGLWRNLGRCAILERTGSVVPETGNEEPEGDGDHFQSGAILHDGAGGYTA